MLYSCVLLIYEHLCLYFPHICRVLFNIVLILALKITDYCYYCINDCVFTFLLILCSQVKRHLNKVVKLIVCVT